MSLFNTRRKFLKSVIIAAGSVTSLGWAACLKDDKPLLTQDITVNPDLFSEGVASGDPKSDSVILWTRLNASFLDSAITTINLVVWEESSSIHSPIVAVGNIGFSEEYDQCVKVKITGLSAYTTYFYQFIYIDQQGNRQSSRIGRTKTAPAPHSDQAVKFAVASCQDFVGRYYNAYLPLIEDHINTDFVVFLGDFIYETTEDPRFQSLDKERKITFTDQANAITLKQGQEDEHQAARSLDNYRELYKTYRSDPVLQEILSQFPIISIWDDHEFSDDCWQFFATYEERLSLDDSGSGEKDPERCLNAMQAFVEFSPIDDSEWVGFDNNDNAIADSQGAIFQSETTGATETAGCTVKGPMRPRIIRDFEFGCHVKLMMTDYRSYRPDSPIAEDQFPGNMIACQSELEQVFGVRDLNSLSNDITSSLTPYCTWSGLLTEPNRAIAEPLLYAVAQQYTRKGVSVNDAIKRAKRYLQGDEGSQPLIDVSIVNDLLSDQGLTVVENVPYDGHSESPLIENTQGLSFKAIGKSSYISYIGSRYAMSPKKLFTIFSTGVPKRLNSQIEG